MSNSNGGAKRKHMRTVATRTLAGSFKRALAVYDDNAKRLAAMEGSLSALRHAQVQAFDVKTFGAEIRKSALEQRRRLRLVISKEGDTDVLGLYCVMAQQTCSLIQLVDTVMSEER